MTNEPDGYIQERLAAVFGRLDPRLRPPLKDYSPRARRFTDAVAVVTGAASGIGMCTAARLAQEGATVIGLDRDSESLEAVVHDISRWGAAEAITVDLTDSDAVDETIARIDRHHGRISVLVNSAGVSRRTEWSSLTNSQWDSTFDLNLRATFGISREVAQVMARGGGGRIVNIASGAAKDARPFGIDYAASKAGVLSITRSLARALAGHRIAVNAVCPGGILTEIAVQPDGWGLPGARGAAAQQEWGRAMDPREVGALVAFLASPEAEYISGQAINIDDAGNVIS